MGNDNQTDPPAEGNEPEGDKPTERSREELERDRADLERALARERKDNTALKAKYDRQAKEMTEAQMSEQEKAVAKARDEGKAEALKAAGMRLAAAEFRAAAAGKIADPAAAVDLVDLSRFVDDDGEPDSDAIAKAVDRLAAGAAPASPNGRVPGGPRSAPEESTDFVRAALGR